MCSHDHSNQASAFSNWWPEYLWEQTVKYWCEDSQGHGVASGMVLKKRKVEPRALLGTYYWIWGGGMGADDELAAEEDMEGHLTITSSKKSNVALKDINATFQVGVEKGSFRGLKLQNRSTPNCFAMKESIIDGIEDTGNHCIAVSEEVDDRGNPYVIFGYDYGPGGCHEGGGFYAFVAKKDSARMSAAELHRLGIYVDAQDMEDEVLGGKEEDVDETKSEAGSECHCPIIV